MRDAQRAEPERPGGAAPSGPAGPAATGSPGMPPHAATGHHPAAAHPATTVPTDEPWDDAAAPPHEPPAHAFDVPVAPPHEPAVRAFDVPVAPPDEPAAHAFDVPVAPPDEPAAHAFDVPVAPPEEPGWVLAERRLLAALRGCGHRPGVAVAARGLSFSGEHGALWLAAGLAAAALDRPRRHDWLRGTALVATAHLASMGVKRLVRRPRPAPGGYEPLVRTAGPHSFPSSHATSAAAAVVAFGVLHPTAGRLAAPVAGAMCLSRLVVGVHYPSDVAVGVLLGAATAAAGRRLLAPATPTRARGEGLS